MHSTTIILYDTAHLQTWLTLLSLIAVNYTQY